MSDHDQYREWSAAYVLGALDAKERALFETHLDGCDRCRDDVAAFAPIPGLLAKVGSPDSEDVPEGVLDRAVARVSSERAELAKSRSRWRWTAAVAAVAAGFVLVVSLLPQMNRPESTLLAIEPGAVATGEISVSARAWGTAIDLDLSGLPPSDRYEAWAVDRSGTVQQIASWGPTQEFNATLEGASSFPLEDVETIIVTMGEDAETVLVTASR